MKTTSSFSWGNQRPGLPHSPHQSLPKPGSQHLDVGSSGASCCRIFHASCSLRTSGPQPCSSPGGGYLTDHKAPTPQVWPPLPLGSWLLPSPAFARAWESSTALAANYSASPFICWLGSLDFVICYAEVFFLTNLFTRFNSSIMFSF